MAQQGQCLCGAIRYQLKVEPFVAGVCHCKNCQRQAGSAFSTIVGVAKSGFDITKGAPKQYLDSDTHTGNDVQRYFCANCGSPIYSALDSQPDTIYVKSGTLDDTSSFKPTFQAWCDSKQTWVTLEKDVPAMATQG